jgi:hypothetical protein
MAHSTTKASGWSIRVAAEHTVILATATMLPYFVHVLPTWDDTPLGARLLPIFYAPLVALYTGRPWFSAALAFVAPWANHFLFGMPDRGLAIVLTWELLLFSAMLWVLLRAVGPAFWLGPAAYVLIKPLSAGLLLLWPLLPPPPLQFAAHSILNAWPGLIALAILGFTCGRIWPGRMAHG